MTANQRELWNLYAGGHTVSEIARLTGRARSTISTTLKTIRQNMQRPNDDWEKKSVPCVYSSSCFTCPLKDCVVSGRDVLHVNMLPFDAEVHA